MTGAQAIAAAVAVLKRAGVEDPARDARHLLAHVLGITRDRLTLATDQPLSTAAQAAFDRAIARRAGREPVSHITGRRAFYGRDFKVTRDVLDPRPETECLVELALRGSFATVLDLGSGSGCILLSLLAERPEASGVGIDRSQPAIDLARANAVALALAERAEFRPGDWFGAAGAERFDLIVANPPYIAEAELAELEPEVRDHEPRMALTPGPDGLAAYRVIAAGLHRHLHPGGRVLLEIGPTQGGAVTALLKAAGLQLIAVHPDLDGRDRVVEAFSPPQGPPDDGFG